MVTDNLPHYCDFLSACTKEVYRYNGKWQTQDWRVLRRDAKSVGSIQECNVTHFSRYSESLMNAGNELPVVE